jgi:cytochrome c5
MRVQAGEINPVSKQDSQFFNLFSLVIGILVAIALVLMSVARAIGRNTQAEHVVQDKKYIESVERNISPHVRVAVAGQDNTALAIVEENPNAVKVTLAIPEDGPSLYQAACTSCHGQGIGGAPKTGDKAAWAARISTGKAILYKHAIEGYTGKAGVMPPKGGRIDLSDDLIKLGVDYLIEQAR